MRACMIHMLTTRLAPHDRLMCKLAGRSKAVELAYIGYQWLYKSWAAAFDGTACRGAMASIALPHVSTENDKYSQFRTSNLTYSLLHLVAT